MENKKITYSIINEAKNAKKEIRKRIISYIAAALGLVAGLAWNDAVKELINYFFPKNGSGVLAKFIYAFSITIVVGFLIYYIDRLFSKKEEK